MACRKIGMSGMWVSAANTKLTKVSAAQLSSPTLVIPILSAVTASPTWLNLSRGKRTKVTRRTLAGYSAPHPSAWRDVEYPEPRKADEDYLAARHLPELPKIPHYSEWHRAKPPKHSRDIINIRGPELIHNNLIHKQYGIVAEQGGFLRHENYEHMRVITDKMLDFTRMFAQYRVDPLYQSWTKKAVGQRMGGGKGSVHHYVTPIKEGRVIMEVGGECTYEEVRRCLTLLANSMPFKAKAVTYEQMISDEEREKFLESANINPFTLDYAIKYNMMGCWKHLGYYDYVWKLKYD